MAKPKLLENLEEVDLQLAGCALEESLFDELETLQIHHAHGVAGRIQDRVISILTRLTMEMASREDS